MTITFHDVSHYNGAYVPTGPTIAKATEGTTFVDSQYGGIRRRTLAGGWPFLPYHFLHRGNISAQVDHAFSVIGRHSLMLDVESSKVSPDSRLADVYAFADLWKTVTGKRVTLAYIPRWYWSGHWGSPSLAGLTSRGIGLVSSLYDHGHADDGPGWDPYGGVHPIIWQYTSTPLDTNAFKGTTAQLADLWAHGTGSDGNPSVPVQPPEEDMDLTPQNLADIAHACAAYKNAADAADVDMHQHAKDATAALGVLKSGGGSAPAGTVTLSPDSIKAVAAAVDVLIAARYAN